MRESQPRWLQRLRGKPTPAPASPSLRTETQARDSALDLLEETRSDLVGLAYDIAMRLCQERGEVSSTDVWQELRAKASQNPALAARLGATDERWMGAVFRESRGWKRLRWEATGSHRRPVSVWTRSIVE